MTSAAGSEEDAITTFGPGATTPEKRPEAPAARSGAEPSGGADAREDAPEIDEEQASAEVMALLSEHVPLALLADLAQPEGPASPRILQDEGLPDEPWWE